MAHRVGALAVLFLLLFVGTVRAQEEKEAEPTAYPLVPVIFYSEETGLGLGAMLVTVFDGEEENQRPDSLQMMAFYTTEKQYLLSVNPDLYFDDGRHHLSLGGFVSHTPSTFWGVGREAGENGTEEDYTQSAWGLNLEATTRLRGPLRVGILYGMRNLKITDKEPGRLLDGDLVEGSDGGREIGAGVLVEWDGRDSAFWPTTGGRYRASAVRCDETLGSDFEFSVYEIDARQYRQTSWGGIFALRGYFGAATGDTPFFSYPHLGGANTLRGLYEGRYRDSHAAAAQVEYRHQSSQRLGWVAFAAVGAIGKHAADLLEDDPLVTGGGGFRFALDPKNKINLRVDVGASRHGVTPYIMINEAF